MCAYNMVLRRDFEQNIPTTYHLDNASIAANDNVEISKEIDGVSEMILVVREPLAAMGVLEKYNVNVVAEERSIKDGVMFWNLFLSNIASEDVLNVLEDISKSMPQTTSNFTEVPTIAGYSYYKTNLIEEPLAVEFGIDEFVKVDGVFGRNSLGNLVQMYKAS